MQKDAKTSLFFVAFNFSVVGFIIGLMSASFISHGLGWAALAAYMALALMNAGFGLVHYFIVRDNLISPGGVFDVSEENAPRGEAPD